MKPTVTANGAASDFLFLQGGSIMSDRIRNFNWAGTPLGQPGLWPVHLRAALGIVMHMGFPALLLCGKELLCLFNDPFLKMMGDDGHGPDKLGLAAPDAWPDGWASMQHPVQKVLEQGQTIHLEDVPLALLWQDGAAPAFWTLSFSPVLNAEGLPEAVLVMCTETTSKVTRFNNLLKQTRSPIAIFKGPDLVIDVANQATLRLWQAGPEVIGRPLAAVLPEMEAQGFTQILRGVLQTGQTYMGIEVPGYFLREDGTREMYYWNFEHSAYTEANGEVTGVIALAYDVTQQVESRKQLEQSRQQLHLLANVIPQLVWLTGPDGLTDWQNERWKEFFGAYHKGNDWVQLLHPDDVAPTQQKWHAAVNEGTPYEVEYRFLDKRTGKYRWFLGKARPIRDAEGQVVKWFGTCTDIDDQKALTEQLEELVANRTQELQRSNEDLLQFTHVASHDLKEPIRKVLVFQNRLQEEYGHLLPEKASLYLQKIEEASRRSFAMINGIVHYSSLHISDYQLGPVNLNTVLDQVASDLEVLLLEKQADLRYVSLPVVQGIHNLLYHLFYNLVCNALKFSSPEVLPVVEVSAEFIAGDAADARLLHTHKPLVRIRVKDNGIGFRQAYAEKIFHPFTRLHSKEKYEGTGLGLSLCRKIAERLGGLIYAQGTEGSGATFTIILLQG